MNNPIKPRCADCSADQLPIYEISYEHPNVELTNLVTGSVRTVPGKPVLKRICAKCASIYEKVGTNMNKYS